MPLITIKPLIITTSLVVGASLALYESHPQIRALVDSAATRLVDMFEEVLDVLDAQLRLLTPEQREERRRRQRERVRTAVGEPILFEAGHRQQHVDNAQHAGQNGMDTETQTRNTNLDLGDGFSTTATGVELAPGSAREMVTLSEILAADESDKRSKRRRLWEMSEPSFQASSANNETNDSAIDVSGASPSLQRAQSASSQHHPFVVPETAASQPIQPDPREISQDTISETSSLSSYDAINTPTSHSPSEQPSPAPSIAPSDLVDELSSSGERDLDYGNNHGHHEEEGDDNDDASTETMSHVSGYSFGDHCSGIESDTEDVDRADVMSISSSSEVSEDWQSIRS